MDYDFVERALLAFGRAPRAGPFELLDLSVVHELVSKSGRLRRKYCSWEGLDLATDDGTALRGYKAASGMTLELHHDGRITSAHFEEQQLARAMSRALRAWSSWWRVYAVDPPRQTGHRCGVCGESAHGSRWARHLRCWARCEL